MKSEKWMREKKEAYITEIIPHLSKHGMRHHLIMAIACYELLTEILEG